MHSLLSLFRGMTLLVGFLLRLHHVNAATFVGSTAWRRSPLYCGGPTMPTRSNDAFAFQLYMMNDSKRNEHHPSSSSSSSRIQGNRRLPTESELAIMDEMIDKLANAKPYELPNAVQRAFRVISSPHFFLRIASRQDVAESDIEKAKLSALASNLVSTLEAVVSTTEERLDERAEQVESVLKAAAEPDSGEFLVPLSRERMQSMRAALIKLDASALDEGFLSTIDTYMNKSHKDGMDGMVTILQKCLQLSAGITLNRALSKAVGDGGDADDAEATAVLQQIWASDSDQWDMILLQTKIPLSRVQAMVQKTLESIVMNATTTGSTAQRVQAEYLREIAKRIDNILSQQKR